MSDKKQNKQLSFDEFVETIESKTIQLVKDINQLAEDNGIGDWGATLIVRDSSVEDAFIVVSADDDEILHDRLKGVLSASHHLN